MSVWEKARWKAVGVLGRFFLRTWAKTSRMSVLGEEEYRRAREGGKSIILLIWHGRLMLAPFFFRKRRIAALVSPSKDGEIIAQIGLGWRFRIVRGSGSHSMVRAWIGMKQNLKKGGELIIVPDGPRGPDRKLKPGALKLAQETGALLVPWSYSASRKTRLKSWDHFLFFYPFSRIVAIYGKPLTVRPALDEEDLERERQRVEQALSALDAEADAHFC
ncbi:MAG TPA: lysophospholipid acyltransferase family protein [Candidatus Desulfaltia sp.]|nr:lysophospholipid acyltransferase family protein [Candidatus Desulfaltia sp.]